MCARRKRDGEWSSISKEKKIGKRIRGLKLSR
jgi:hypothetical protein